MLPRWHILFGALFTSLLFYVAPDVGWINLSCVFVASFMIDLDHYINGAVAIRKISPFKAMAYYDDVVTKKIWSDRKKGLRRKEPHFHFFHTIEFHLLIALIGIFYTPFFYIFIGMTFHSLLDVYAFMRDDILYIREYFFFNWLAKQF